jgi:uncharacterized membrane protein
MDDRDIDVCVLMLGVDAEGRTRVESAMKRIAEKGDSSRPDGLVKMLREAIGVLRAERASWTHAAAENFSPMAPQDAEPKFAAAAHRARSRFAHELVRNYAGETRTKKAPENLPPPSAESIVVVTLVVAARRELGDVNDVRDVGALERALDELAAIDAGDFAAMEVIWSPADERDRPSVADVEARYPELVRLGAKA